MKALKWVLIACSLSAAAVAHAQTATPADGSAQQVAQANTATRVAQPQAKGREPKPAQKTNECVGPVSYCVMYFGS
ncbi:hypothetical protein H3V53_37925 [Paraburkholderia bengalensis]|uniref:Uncharacterized protein n=1 Tax=Paraburkholderia bengalensis TaxID=2747562 RepID=A0ABU8J3X8_9BURK